MAALSLPAHLHRWTRHLLHPWSRNGMFWRTFFFLAFLITCCMSAWIISFNCIEKAPAARQLAAQIVSVVSITRAALTHAAPTLRRELLSDLANYEGIRIYTLEPSDHIQQPEESTLMMLIQQDVRASLGPETHFAGKVNQIPGFWVSFRIDHDDYWLMLDRSRINHPSGLQWLSWSMLVLVLSLFGAALLSRLINRRLARLTAAACTIAKGEFPPPLPEKGSIEIIEANRSFNRMVNDLQRIESDRALILAGISHDLRTPLSRLQLEIEMADLSDDSRQGMHADIAQIDAIIKQFLDYARPEEQIDYAPLDLSALLADSANEANRQSDIRLNATLAPKVIVKGKEIELRRVFSNLIENARRYGKSAGQDIAEIDLFCASKTIEGVTFACIELRDHGIGIPEADIAYLMRPFSRLDNARSQANGAGLGLAIVNRILQRHQARLDIRNHPRGGLSINIQFKQRLPPKRRIAQIGEIWSNLVYRKGLKRGRRR